MDSPVELSIIIVSFNTKDMTMACLESLKREKHSGDSWEIIVVDNGSTDGSAEAVRSHYKDITLIAQTRNLGFAKANNIGIKKSKGNYLLLLNSDTEISESAIQSMLVFLKENPKAGASTCKLELTDGRIDPASHRGFPDPWASFTYFFGLEALFPHSRLFSRYHMWYKNMTVSHQIDCPSGAFFLLRRSVINTVGLLDENFFMYGEDIDLAYRIKKAGWEIWFNPAVVVRHKKKQSGRSHNDMRIRKQTHIYFYQTMLQFYEKHYKIHYPVILYYILRAVIRARIFIVCALE